MWRLSPERQDGRRKDAISSRKQKIQKYPEPSFFFLSEKNDVIWPPMGGVLAALGPTLLGGGVGCFDAIVVILQTQSLPALSRAMSAAAAAAAAAASCGAEAWILIAAALQ